MIRDMKPDFFVQGPGTYQHTSNNRHQIDSFPASIKCTQSYWWRWRKTFCLAEGRDKHLVFFLYCKTFGSRKAWQSSVKNPPAKAGDKRDVGSIPGLGRSPNEGNGNPLLYFCLENPRDRAVWWAAVQRVAKSSTRLKQLSTCSIRNLSASTRNRGVLTTGPPGKSPSLLLAT